MSNDDNNPTIIQAASPGSLGDSKPVEKKDPVVAVAGEAPGGVAIEALALKVYALMKQEVRIERERSVRN